MYSVTSTENLQESSRSWRTSRICRWSPWGPWRETVVVSGRVSSVFLSFHMKRLNKVRGNSSCDSRSWNRSCFYSRTDRKRRKSRQWTKIKPALVFKVVLQGLHDGDLEVLERLACLAEWFLKGFQKIKMWSETVNMFVSVRFLLLFPVFTWMEDRMYRLLVKSSEAKALCDIALFK